MARTKKDAKTGGNKPVFRNMRKRGVGAKRAKQIAAMFAKNRKKIKDRSKRKR